MGKHRRTSLFRRMFPKRTLIDQISKNVSKSDIPLEPAERVLIMPRVTAEVILGNYCPN